MNKILLPLLFAMSALIVTQFAYNDVPLAINKYFLAQVGVSASVEPNPFNSMAQKFAERQIELDQKEAELEIREKALKEVNASASREVLLISLLGWLALLALVLINYYLDYKRQKYPLYN